MKYSEFKAEVEKMGLNVDSSDHRVFVRRKSGNVVVAIYKSVENFVDCGWASYLDTANDEQRGQLFDLAYQLAKTPLEEREEEKRYWLIANLPQLEEHSWFYLNRNIKNGKCTLGTKTRSSSYQTIFTESEIAEMDITGFEKIEVSE